MRQDNEVSGHYSEEHRTHLNVGDAFSVTESFRTRDVMLYMGVTGDMDPIYLQSWANKNAHPIVPTIALIGVMTRTISMHFPGPGSRLVEMNYTTNGLIYRDSTVTFNFEVIRIDTWKNYIMIHVIGNNETTREKGVIDAMLTILPPEEHPQLFEATNHLTRVEGGDKTNE